MVDKLGVRTLLPYFESLGEASFKKDVFIRIFKRPLIELSEYYFQLGKMYFRRTVPGIRSGLGGAGTQDEETPSNEYLEEAFMLFYTASSLGSHK